MAKSLFRRIVKKTLITINVIITVLFLTACLSPFLNPARWWLIGFAGLMFPYLLLALIFFVIFWLIVRPRMVWVSLLTFLLGWQQISVIFAWHPGAGFSKKRQENFLRIVDWNVQSFNGLSKNAADKANAASDLVKSIIKQQPDVICLQEFNTAANSDNIALFKEQYWYHYFSKDYRRANGTYQSGCIIFSKFPIVDSGKMQYPVAESLIYADIVKGGDTIRIYTTHLQSFKFQKADYNDLEKIREQDEETITASKSIIKKMKLAFQRRGIQANMVRTEIDKSPHPSVICGDFNDVPNSYAYFHIKGDRQDVCLKKGFGISRTFIALAPTLRIDYILPTRQFEVKQFDMVDENLSDHIMLVTDLLLKK
ncbi:MAG: endonuclease/exonuclease/phosphatase family protein [Bacteroidota bacterium]